MRYLVTGGAGFIGSNFIRHLFESYGDDALVVNLDKLTYAGNRENLAEFEGRPNYRFVKGDIASPEDVAKAYEGVQGSGIDVVVNFAAETHVDRSLMEAGTFIETDVHGVLVLLEEARTHAPDLQRFVQISTDEVYGSIDSGSFSETDLVNPRNPYSASKAGGDRMASRLRGNLRHAGGHHARFEQFRPLPVPRETDSPVRHERDGRSIATALR